MFAFPRVDHQCGGGGCACLNPNFISHKPAASSCCRLVLLLLLPQNPEYTGDNKSYARSLKKTAAAVEYIQLDVAGPVTQRELSQASAAYMQNINANSSSSSSGGRGDGQAAAAAGAAAGQDEDAFLRFSVRFRQRDGGPQEVATEVSHFKKVDGTTWLYFNEVEFIRDGAGANSS